MTAQIDPRHLARARVHVFNILEQITLLRSFLREREDLFKRADDLQRETRTLRTVLDMESINLTPPIPPSERKDQTHGTVPPSETGPAPSTN